MLVQGRTRLRQPRLSRCSHFGEPRLGRHHLAALALELLRAHGQCLAALLVLDPDRDQPVALRLDGLRQPVELALAALEVSLALGQRGLAHDDLALPHGESGFPALP